MKTEIERRAVEIRADASTGVLTGILIPYGAAYKNRGDFCGNFSARVHEMDKARL